MEHSCGSCTLCCKLVPVPALAKKANERCRHQRHGKGCAIYDDRPASCRLWSCYWLLGDDTEGLRRPDHVHYVIDCMTDNVAHHDHETGAITRIPVIQVWCDPKHPDAWQDDNLRRWLERMYELHGTALLVRYDNVTGIMGWPPGLSGGNGWQFARPQLLTSAAEVQQMIQDAPDFVPLGKLPKKFGKKLGLESGKQEQMESKA